MTQPSFHSISFPSEWGEEVTSFCDTRNNERLSFHSISFPSEWGVESYWAEEGKNPGAVSIQLVSPASGEGYLRLPHGWVCCLVSIQLVSPASGESWI